MCVSVWYVYVWCVAYVCVIGIHMFVVGGVSMYGVCVWCGMCMYMCVMCVYMCVMCMDGQCVYMCDVCGVCVVFGVWHVCVICVYMCVVCVDGRCMYVCLVCMWCVACMCVVCV